MKYLMTIWSQSPEDYFIIDNLINYLKRKKKLVSIICQNKNFNNKLSDRLNCNSHKIFYYNYNFLNKFYFIYYLIYLIFYIFIKKPDVLIIFNNYPIVIVQFIKFFYKGKLIYHNFDYDPLTKNKFKKILNFFEEKNIHKFNKVIFSNEKRAEIFKKKLSKKIDIDIIYNCLPINYFIKSKSKKKGIIKIFRIGTIGPGHGLVNLIKSFKYLPHNYQLILCGIILDKNFYYDLLNIIEKNAIENKIRVFISPSQKEWTKKMFSSDLGIAFYEPVNTSHKYMIGASQKINSYLAAGLPILLSNEKQFKFFTKKYNCSINTNIKKPYKIALTIKKIFSNKIKLKQLKKYSKVAFKNYFNFEKQIKKVDYYL